MFGSYVGRIIELPRTTLRLDVNFTVRINKSLSLSLSFFPFIHSRTLFICFGFSASNIIATPGISPNTCSTTFASTLYDFKKRSIMRTPLPASYIHRFRYTPPPPLLPPPPLPFRTCALCQHFRVFYCGYKRVSPSEPLSNNTGPLC